ncbi:unnamed protein product [Tenebrio molitor]|nr:unnamed protein product [Tenebrio molitor]
MLLGAKMKFYVLRLRKSYLFILAFNLFRNDFVKI